jgi:AcrR family transcriptional regulator
VAIAERTTQPETRRGKGKRAGLDLARIVDAARSLDPDAITMQAVADELGVDRKALNHHVNDRDSLLELVAFETFTVHFSAFSIAANGRWQEACRAYALELTASVIALGGLADHLRLGALAGTLPSEVGARFLGPTEAVFQKLGEGGFDDEAATRAMALLTTICLGFAADVIASRHGPRPRPTMLRSTLNRTDATAFENLTRIAAASIDTYDKKQLEMSIEVFIAGTEALLDRK